jgi:hypothetical protein
MKKAKQWGKPEVVVLSFTKPSSNVGSSQKTSAQNYLGPAPAPAPAVPRDAQYYLGPAPAPPSKDVIW